MSIQFGPLSPKEKAYMYTTITVYGIIVVGFTIFICIMIFL